MAKQRKRAQQNTGTSSIATNSFLKGMNKDITQSMEPNQSWWNARNAANNSTDGDMGVIGNEPANLQCGVIPYTIIGAIHRYGDQWIVYSTDDTNSEIGTFDDSECKYEVLVNDPCLNFKKKFLITGAAKENFDCTWQVYWDDGNNPSRTLNIDEIPWKQYISSAPGDPCVVYSDIEPKQLDCEKIRLAPLMDTPCVKLSKDVDGGMLRNGAYQAFIAYTENEQKVTDYIGISNIQTLWSHAGSGGSINIKVTNLDTKFDYYQLAILMRQQGQVFAKKIGLYSTQQQDIGLDFISDELEAVDIAEIPKRNPAYEKSNAMYVVNDWLIRQGPTEKFDFNYQPIANQIKTNWVSNQVDSKYYTLGGSKLGFLRDEQYAFFIRWIYNTGERSSSYHIPGRAPEMYNGNLETDIIFGDNALDDLGDPVYKVYNTGSITQQNISELQDDDSFIIGRGKMGYWESTERYPSDRPDIWGDLCGKPIRHHKFPTEEVGGPNSPLHISTTDGDNINLLGVEFTNIGRPKYNDGSYLQDVVGYEILRGSRTGAKSILAKGLFRNMREYTVPNAENLIGGSVQGLYANYPYNDLRPDLYFWKGGNDLNRTDSCDNLPQSISSFAPLDGYSKKAFTFASPDLMFTKPFLNAYETRIYGEITGKQSGYFKASEDHPQFKLLRNGAAVIAAVIGIGYAVAQIQGDRGAIRSGGGGGNWMSNDFYMGFGTGGTTGLGASAAVNSAGAIINSGISEVAANVYEAVDSTLALADLWAGGSALELAQVAYGVATATAGVAPGGKPGEYQITTNKNTSMSQLPSGFRILISVTTSAANIAIGGNEIIELIYNLVNKSDFVFKYNSQGFFNDFKNSNLSIWRFKNEDSNYLGSSFQTFNNGEYKINNLFRPSTVAVALEKELQDPLTEDKSRFTIGGYVRKDGSVGEWSDNYLLNPDQSKISNISAYYGSLKFNFDNQYGQLSGIKQIPMRGCVELLDPTKPDQFMYSTKALVAGDTFIGRYTEKVIMPIFSQYLLGQPDEFTYDYSMHVNIPYPRYWLDSQRFDMTGLAQQIATLGIAPDPDDLFPNDLFYLDRGNDSCSQGFTNIFRGANANDPNPILAMRYAYMYSHNNGVLDFFVESEINLAHRDWEDTQARQIYDVYQNNDIDALFHAQIEKKDNYYKYDESLSPSRFPSQISSFGEIQPLYYDPYVAANCYVSRPKRLIYSLQAQDEAKKDFWRVFLPLNYKDFKNKVSVIKPMSKTGALVFFPFLSPQLFQGVDSLKLGSNTNVTIGDGKLFNQPLQNVTNSDISNEYGSCESLRSVINTPVGLFFISQAQGKIFQYTGKGLDPISNNGMKWWFNKYLPSQLIKQFPILEDSVLSDNPIAGVGCQAIYDPNDDIVYFMKKDYRIKSKWIANVTYSESKGFEFGGYLPITIGDPVWFDDCSWTISYDPKGKGWVSFHDWHPELALPSINHFFTTKTIDSETPICPPGYTYNATNGLCERIQSTSELASVIIEEVDADVQGGATLCLLDIVIAMDTSGSTGGGPNSIRQAQQDWLSAFLTDPNISGPMATGRFQIGLNAWATTRVDMNPNGFTMSNTVTEPQVTAWYNSVWGQTPPGTGTAVGPALTHAQNRVNLKAGSQLGDRSSNPAFRQIIIFITDTNSNPGNIGCPFQGINNSPTATGPANQDVFALYCGATNPSPPNPNVLTNISCTPGPINVDGYQYGIAANNPAQIALIAANIAANACSIPTTCNCPPGYTLVYPNPTTGEFIDSSGPCEVDAPPTCRKIECECPPGIPGFPTTTTGVCDDLFLVGSPTYVNPNPLVCNSDSYETAEANFRVGAFWRHNVRCDLFANYYGVDYPWEIDLVEQTGQMVNTVRSVEYQLETYVYKGDMGHACNDDKWEDLLFNFDQAIIYNNEQVSGSLKLIPTPFNEPLANLTYPIVSGNNIDILCSKVEQKYRFNQFWDITNDRGEFTFAEQPIWRTAPNGYIKNLNVTNLNYNKSQLQHKKFRHYANNFILKRLVSGNRKMLLRLFNTKLLTSLR